MARTTEELDELLIEQLEFIRSSSKAFDSGIVSEAKRLALHIRILVHDSKNSVSLLSQLGIKETIGFVDTAQDLDPANCISHTGLLVLRVSFDPNIASGFVPIFEKNGLDHTKSFNDWWNKIIFKDKQTQFTRKDIVEKIANKEGGAHVDRTMDVAYQKLTEGNSLGWTTGDYKPLPQSPGLVAVRQIAFELEESLKQNSPPNNRPIK